MEREMIHYLLWDLIILRPNLTAFADRIKASTMTVYVVITNMSREKDSFGNGVIERQTIASEPASATKPAPAPISIPSAPVAVDSHLPTSSDPPPSYTTYLEDNRLVSPRSDSSSESSRES